ncbi:MAG: hypothetical protein NT005_02825 [Spirochaetes bacterium]|nr:hypothetical protein [Spirochaetota bacterium]
MKLYLDGKPAHGRLETKDGRKMLELDNGRSLQPGDIMAQDIVELNPEELHWIVSAASAYYRA